MIQKMMMIMIEMKKMKKIMMMMNILVIMKVLMITIQLIDFNKFKFNQIYFLEDIKDNHLGKGYLVEFNNFKIKPKHVKVVMDKLGKDINANSINSMLAVVLVLD